MIAPVINPDIKAIENLEDLDNQIIKFPFSKEYTRKQLKEAFDKVLAANTIPAIGTAWKNPIDAEIPIEDLKITEVAIIYFVGDCPVISYGAIEIEDIATVKTVRIITKGYYATIGA
jgi:hypothetical protein